MRFTFSIKTVFNDDRIDVGEIPREMTNEKDLE